MAAAGILKVFKAFEEWLNTVTYTEPRIPRTPDYTPFTTMLKRGYRKAQRLARRITRRAQR